MREAIKCCSIERKSALDFPRYSLCPFTPLFAAFNDGADVSDDEQSVAKSGSRLIHALIPRIRSASLPAIIMPDELEEYLAVLKATYDYDATEPDECTIKENQILLLVEKTDDE